MTKVADIMTTDVITVSPETKVTEATKILLEKRINGLPVVDARNTILGIICQSDIIVQQKKWPVPTVFTLLDGFIPLNSVSHLEKEVKKMSATTVEDAMSQNPTTTGPEAEIEEVAELMVTKNFHSIPVVEDGKLVGIVGKEDILRTLTS